MSNKKLLQGVGFSEKGDRVMQVLSDEESAIPIPRVFITQLAIQKIKCFVDLCKYEINGFGIVQREGNDFVIEDVFLLKQYTSSFDLRVDVDPKALNDFIYYLVKNNEDASLIRLQWHSHVHAPVIFSGRDIDTIGGYMNDYMISLVMNKYGEYNCRLDLFKPFYLSLEVPLVVKIPLLDEELVRQCQEEMRANVIVKFLGIPVGGAKSSPDEIEEVAVNLEDIEEEDNGL